MPMLIVTNLNQELLCLQYILLRATISFHHLLVLLHSGSVDLETAKAPLDGGGLMDLLGIIRIGILLNLATAIIPTSKDRHRKDGTEQVVVVVIHAVLYVNFR